MLKYILGGGGIFIYMIKNGEFYLGGFFPGQRGIFPGERLGIFSGGFLLGDYFRGGGGGGGGVTPRSLRPCV